MSIQYFPLVKFYELPGMFRRMKIYADVDKDNIIADEDFGIAASRALDILKEFCPRQYNWAVNHISSIVNVPTGDGNSFYSCRQNRFYLDFFGSGFRKNENTIRWNTVWLAGIFSFLYVHARVYKFCPRALLVAPDRVDRLCRRQANLLASRASDEIYDFTEIFE